MVDTISFSINLSLSGSILDHPLVGIMCFLSFLIHTQDTLVCTAIFSHEEKQQQKGTTARAFDLTNHSLSCAFFFFFFFFDQTINPLHFVLGTNIK